MQSPRASAPHRDLRLLFAGVTIVFAGFSACSSSSKSTGSSAGSSSSTGPASNASSGVSSSGSTGGSPSSGAGGSSSSGITLAGSSGAGGSDGGCQMMGNGTCTSDAQCDDGDPSTTDTCLFSGGEVTVGTCVHVACDGGVSCSVDTTCSIADAGTVYPPYVPLYAPDVPTTCANGFEICDAEGAPTYTIKATPADGSRALTLDLDFATYLAPDGLLITGIDGDCNHYVLFDSCRLQTATEAESAYTNGMMRPSDESIRQFHLALRQGTSQLTFDFSRVDSPMYFQVLGLCDFALPAAPSVGWFNLVP